MTCGSKAGRKQYQMPPGEDEAKLHLRLPASLLAALDREASRQGVSLNYVAVALLQDGLERPEQKGKRDPSTPLGKYVVARRQEMGLSQYELSQRLGWQQSQLYEIEMARQRKVPQLPTLQKLAHALQVDLTSLLAPLGYSSDADGREDER